MELYSPPPVPLHHVTATPPADPDLAGAELVLQYGLAMLLTIAGITYAALGHPELVSPAIVGALAVVRVVRLEPVQLSALPPTL